MICIYLPYPSLKTIYDIDIKKILNIDVFLSVTPAKGEGGRRQGCGLLS